MIYFMSNEVETRKPFTPFEGMKELSFNFSKMKDFGESGEFGFNADVNVWVPYSDSLSEMNEAAKPELREFLEQMLKSLD